MKLQSQWLIAILIAPFLKGCIYPGWSSASELAACCALVGFLSYFRPKTPLDSAQERKLEKMEAEVAGLRESFVALKLKFGFRT